MNVIKKTTIIMTAVASMLGATAAVVPQNPDGSSCIVASAANCTSNGWSYYDDTINGVKGVVISAYSGSATNVVLPNTLGGKKVVGISDGIFKNNTKITSITMNAVETIPYEFALGCTSLKKVTFNSANKVISAYAFDGCDLLSNVTLPSKLERIEFCAFSGCYALASITLPSTVNYLGGGCFSFSHLTSIKISKSLDVCSTGNGTYAPFYQSPLQTAVIENGATKIPDYLFANCTKLTSVTIPITVKTIEENAFKKCNSLEHISLPSTVSYVGKKAFIDCKNLKWITLENWDVDFEGDEVFTGCSNLTVYVTKGSKTETKCKNLGVKVAYGDPTSEVAVPDVTVKSNYTSTPNMININWNKVTGVTGYKIYRYDTVTKKTVLAGTVGGSATVTYRDSGLVSGRKYLYQVQGFISNGKMYEGKKSTPFAAYTKPATVKMSSGYTAATDAIRINWGKAQGATGYIVYRWNGKSWSRLAKVGANVTTYRDSKGIIAGGQYKYKVQSYTIIGNTVIYGNSSAVKTAAAKPSAVKITNTASASDAVRLNWSRVKCDGYQIYRYQDGKYVLLTTIRNSNVLTYRAEGLRSGRSYKFKIRAFRYDGSGAQYGSFTQLNVYTG